MNRKTFTDLTEEALRMQLEEQTRFYYKFHMQEELYAEIFKEFADNTIMSTFGKRVVVISLYIKNALPKDLIIVTDSHDQLITAFNLKDPKWLKGSE